MPWAHFSGVVCIDEKWRVLSLNTGKGRVYREESPISVGILTISKPMLHCPLSSSISWSIVGDILSLLFLFSIDDLLSNISSLISNLTRQRFLMSRDNNFAVSIILLNVDRSAMKDGPKIVARFLLLSNCSLILQRSDRSSGTLLKASNNSCAQFT